MLPQRWWCLSSHNLAKWVVFSGKLYLSSLLTVHIMCTNYIEQSALRCIFHDQCFYYLLAVDEQMVPFKGRNRLGHHQSQPRPESCSPISLVLMADIASVCFFPWMGPSTTPWASRCGSKWQRCPPPGPAYTTGFSTTGLRVSLLCLHWLSREFTPLVLFVATDYQVSTWCAMLSWKEQDVDLLNRRWPWWEKPPCMM